MIRTRYQAFVWRVGKGEGRNDDIVGGQAGEGRWGDEEEEEGACSR